jgi:3-deoxy-D-manno-octulosonate 8-phosphate phosphatase KdsC-like HAD superfamily phosphatase
LRNSRKRAVCAEECACVGDDTPRRAILAAAGIGVAVADAHPDALAVADLSRRAGGRRGPRVDWLIAARPASA